MSERERTEMMGGLSGVKRRSLSINVGKKRVRGTYWPKRKWNDAVNEFVKLKA